LYLNHMFTMTNAMTIFSVLALLKHRKQTVILIELFDIIQYYLLLLNLPRLTYPERWKAELT